MPTVERQSSQEDDKDPGIDVHFDLFLDRAGIELKRAERYRIFVSLIVLDLDVTEDMSGERSGKLLQEVERLASFNARACDYVSFADDHRLCVLYPETSRQGAEAAARRLTDLIREELSRRIGRPVEGTIPLELASFPDAAGAKTVPAFLDELQQQSQN